MSDGAHGAMNVDDDVDVKEGSGTMAEPRINTKETVDGGLIRSPDRESAAPPPLASLFPDATPPRPPSARGNNTTLHSSGPSMVSASNVGQARTMPAHTRNVTPHTESLISLFAKPAATPLTPLTPTISEERTVIDTSRSRIGGGGPPLMPDYSATGERANKPMPKDGPGNPPLNALDQLQLQREVTQTTRNVKNGPHHMPQKQFSDASQQSSLSSHNRDDTLVAGNLKRTVVDAGLRETLVMANIKRGGLLDDDGGAHEKTRLLRSSSSSFEKCDAPKRRNVLFGKLSEMKLLEPASLKPTLMGAFLFSLYQLVFCFAEASAITRPSHPTAKASTLLSPMALMACMGSLISAPMLIGVLGGDIPALYPCLDMFMAPFLAQMAADIDAVLVGMRDEGDSAGNDTGTFLATFVALNAFGMLLSGLLCVLAGKVKLVNLAGFLPYPVLAGFFSSVGISIWMSAFKVDTGRTIQTAIASGDWTSLLQDLARHTPSFVAGGALYVLGPKGPQFLLGIIAATIAFAYVLMGLTGTSLAEAQDMSFFWAPEEVTMSDDAKQFVYGPPKAFGLWSPEVLGKICWSAFHNGLPGVIAMSVIYLLRCSLHAAALNKCAAKLKASDAGDAHPLSSSTENGTHAQSISPNGAGNAPIYTEQGRESARIRPKGKPKDLMMWYANGLFAVALSGGFAVLPAIALGGIFSKIGAVTRGPQFIALLVLLGCYLSDFWICSYVPKSTFSCLLVLASIDLIHGWFIKSYQKSATEWIVVPFIVVTSLAYGMLQSVGLGIGASTLIFVASFYRAGVVKFIANGLIIRSTVERNNEDNLWLDQHADLIQILVLQNYLFFGNASSCLKYIQTMFDDEPGFDPDLPPIPKHIILDLSIVTGIDTSAVDVFADIAALCAENKCKLTLAGIPQCIRPALITGGVKPSRLNRHLTFSPDLESALGKAEDELLRIVGHNEEKAADVGAKLRHIRKVSMVDHGLRNALRSIDTQHSLSMASHLQSLEKHTTPIELNAGAQLNDVGSETNLPRGLYFIEAGVLKCEHDSQQSLTRGRTQSNFFAAPHMKNNNDSIGQVQARSATVGRCANLLKQHAGALEAQNHVFRLARIGPGWLIGSISDFVGQDIPGMYTALTPCRVHHLTFETIEELELESPTLILHLYKLLSHLSARRQEMTIAQLATLRSIMSSNAPTKPISRRKMKALKDRL